MSVFGQAMIGGPLIVLFGSLPRTPLLPELPFPRMMNG